MCCNPGKRTNRNTVVTPQGRTQGQSMVNGGGTPSTPPPPSQVQVQGRVRVLSETQIQQRAAKMKQAKRGSVHLDSDDEEGLSTTTSHSTTPKLLTQEQIAQREARLEQAKRGSVHM